MPKQRRFTKEFGDEAVEALNREATEWTAEEVKDAD